MLWNTKIWNHVCWYVQSKIRDSWYVGVEMSWNRKNYKVLDEWLYECTSRPEQPFANYAYVPQPVSFQLCWFQNPVMLSQLVMWVGFSGIAVQKAWKAALCCLQLISHALYLERNTNTYSLIFFQYQAAQNICLDQSFSGLIELGHYDGGEEWHKPITIIFKDLNSKVYCKMSVLWSWSLLLGLCNNFTQNVRLKMLEWDAALNHKHLQRNKILSQYYSR